MFWIIPAWVLSAIFMFWLGYFLRGIAKKVKDATIAIKQAIPPIEPPKDEPTAMIIDPNDPIQTAIYEHKKDMERLNGTNSSYPQR